ncbi:isoleucine--tRNA ligase [Methanobrevibacter wolinii]|uniref:isoleucine--tRNA ligase n=1 Tax=Methanobrevibacter wolinii TaxID=190977 RepID=UPI0005B2D708|nr:isoleucine--tRNA ligase [Methanobrevibacter wolinii]
MPIEEAEKSYEFAKIDKSVHEFWADKDIFAKVNKIRKNGPQYSFLDGPPYCSGKIHLGTAWNKVIKDTLLRYKSMNGFSLRRQAGWDMHGLPIEHKVEELMGIKSKQEIESKVGISTFVDKCQEFAFKNKLAMTKQFKSLGVWMDWDNPYMTLDPNYMESAWWTLKRANEQNLLTRDKRVISWCPHCETALAAAEMDYEEKEDPSIYLKFPLKQSFLSKEENPEGLKEYVLVWTTTPWTIPANLAICINPKFDYKFVEKDGEIYILAADLVEDVLGYEKTIHKHIIPSENEDEEDKVVKEVTVNYKFIKTVKGSDLIGLKYVYPFLDEIPKQKEFDSLENVHTILPGDHVELGEGTGCVHTAPGHGPDDFEVGKAYNLPIFCPVDESGNFNKDVGVYAGKYTKSYNPVIIDDLISKGFMYKNGTINHRYGICWRCKTPIIYRATEQWFLKVTDIKDKMLSEIEQVNWTPKWAGEGRFHDWVDNAKDWTISRQRYWGIPIPIWICPDCGEVKVIGSIAELKESSLIDTNVEDSKLVHRPFVDEIPIECPKCNGKMKRIPDVLDVWIDSGVAGWASLYYPNEEDKFNKWYPYDFITEGHDQTRGWFYSQLGTGVISLGKAPYKNVLMHGFVLDENGKKMSKSLGNVVSPEEVIEKYGADVLRFYLLWACKPWDDLKFVWDELNNVNKMFNILWNVYVFSTTYMSLDNFQPEKCTKDNIHLRKEDKWIISRVNTLTKEVAKDIEDLYFHKATRKIMDFILEDLSRWYVRLIRGRTWVESDDPDKLGAYYGLYTAIVSLIKLMAPFTPHISEVIYQNLVVGNLSDAKESVHMEDWTVNEDLINKDLEYEMDIVREVIDASIRARDVARYKLRWPVNDITVVSENEKVFDAVKDLEDVIKDQSNTKNVICSSEFDELSYIAKPNLKILGPKLKGDIGIVKKYFGEADGNIIKENLENNGSIIVSGVDYQGNNKDIELSSEEVLFDTELPDDFVSSEFKGGNVFVNTKLTPEILSEAMSRELIRRIQDMRKDMDLDVEANIDVSVSSSESFKDLVIKQIDLISNEVRANNLTINVGECKNIKSNEGQDISNEYTKNWKIEDEDLIIKIIKD